MTHAAVAQRLVNKLPAGVFAHAARDAVIHRDFTQLEKMLPGVHFDTVPVGKDEWHLAAVCEDGSTVIWTVGG